MLRTMRSNLKSLSWTLWLVIIAFIGFIFVEWGSGRFDSFSVESDLLSINGSSIKGEVFQKDLFMALDNYNRQFKNKLNKSFINQLRIPEQVLQRLINSSIMKQEAEKFSLNVSDKELKNKIIDIFQKNGKFIGYPEYKRILDANRINTNDYENELKQQILFEKFNDLITASCVIDQPTLRKKFHEKEDKVELEYIILKSDRITTKMKASETKLKDFYEKNKEKFKSKEKRAGYLIVHKYDDFKKEIKIDEKELFDYFKTNKNQFIIPGKTKISRIYLKYQDNNREKVLKEAEDLQKTLDKNNFSLKAKNISEDEKAKNGGDWGYWEWKKFSKQELAIIERLEENQISTPIDTLQGFSIIQMTEKIKEKQENYDKAKSKIRNIVEKEKLSTMVKNKLTGIYHKLKNEKNIKVSAQKMALKVIDTSLLTNGEPIKELDEMGYISRQMFNLKENEISLPMDFLKGMAIIQLKQIKEPSIEKFEKAYKNIEEKFELIQKIKRLISEGQQLSRQLNELKNSQKKENFLKKKNLSSDKITYKRGNKFSYFPYKKGLDKFIFSLALEQYSTPIEYENEIVIVKPISKNLSDENDFNTKKNEFYQEYIKNQKDNYFATYIMNKREHYKIRLNEKLYKKIRDYILARYK